MLTIDVLAVPALSLSTCRAYCSATPGLHVSGDVARIRATCEAMSAAPLGERRSTEPEPMPRKERRNRLLSPELFCIVY